MEVGGKQVHLVEVVVRRKNKVYHNCYLRHSFREDGKVKTKTLLTLSPEEATKFRTVFEAPTDVSATAVAVAESYPYGDAAAVLAIARSTDLLGILSGRRSKDRKLALGLILAQLLDPGSKVSHADFLSPSKRLSFLGLELGLGEVHENDLYQSMDWLEARQEKIEKVLAARHLKDGGLVLYDMSSSYFEGTHCPMAERAYSRDHRGDLPQINYGLLCAEDGCPVAVEVFPGKVNDVKSMPAQIAKLRDRFGMKRVVVVGDRGMLTDAKVRAELSEAGFGWITALRRPSIEKLRKAQVIQPSLFDETNLAEVTSPDHPGERLVVCFNPYTKDRNQATRESLIGATRAALDKVIKRTKQKRKPLRGKAEIGMAAGAALAHFKAQKYFRVHVEDESLTYELRPEVIEEDGALDGIYVIRSTVDKEQMSAGQLRDSYVSLSQVERAFRCLKSVDLQIRPIRHRLVERVKAHVFLCMLAYYLEWHLRRAWEPLIKEAPKEKSGKPARRRRRRGDIQVPPHSFQGILQVVRSVTRNRIRIGDRLTAVCSVSEMTPLQAEALRLAGCRSQNCAPGTSMETQN
jgi:transposase